MSVAVMDRVFWHSKATGTDLAVLLALARHDFGGDVYPSRERLAGMVHVSVQRVKEAFDRLTALGELSRELRPGRSTLYRIMLTCPPDCAEVGNHGCPTMEAESETTGVRGSETTGVRVRGPEGNPQSPKDSGGRWLPRQKPRARRGVALSPAHDLVADLIQLAIHVEQDRDDAESLAWIGKLARCVGDDRRFILEDWRAAGREAA